VRPSIRAYRRGGFGLPGGAGAVAGADPGGGAEGALGGPPGAGAADAADGAPAGLTTAVPLSPAEVNTATR